MNNQTKRILALTLGFALCGGIASTILGMEPEEPTREELGDTEAVDIWMNASDKEKTTLFNNATPEQKRLILAKTFTKIWLELNEMKKNILKLTENDTMGNKVFESTYIAILHGTFDKAMLWRVQSHWGRVFNQYRKTLASPISEKDYMSMINNNNTPLGQVANAYKTKLIPLLTNIGN